MSRYWRRCPEDVEPHASRVLVVPGAVRSFLSMVVQFQSKGSFRTGNWARACKTALAILQPELLQGSPRSLPPRQPRHGHWQPRSPKSSIRSQKEGLRGPAAVAFAPSHLHKNRKNCKNRDMKLVGFQIAGKPSGLCFILRHAWRHGRRYQQGGVGRGGHFKCRCVPTQWLSNLH